MSIGTDVMTGVMVELGRSIRAWAGSVVLLSGHAGNRDALATAAALLRAEGDDVVGLVPILDGSDAHAGHTETSLMLHLHPELVRMERAEAGRTEPLHELIDALKVGGVISVSANGVLGDPTTATAEEGGELFGRLVDYALGELRTHGVANR